MSIRFRHRAVLGDRVNVANGATLTVYFDDTFTDPNTNGTDITSSNPQTDLSGSGWSDLIISGSANIRDLRQNGSGGIKIQNGAGGNRSWAYVNATTNVGVARSTVNPNTAGGPGIGVHIVDANNHLYCRIKNSGDAVELYSVIAGSSTLRDSISTPTVNAQAYAMKVTTNGTDQVDVDIDSGTWTLTWNDSGAAFGNWSNQNMGLAWAGFDTGATWDDFSFKSE